MTTSRESIAAVSVKARELLSRNAGLFIGEQHGNPLASNFIQANRQMLKEERVTTIYIETSHQLAEAYQGGKECLAGFFSTKPQHITNQANSFLAVVATAQAAGIRVIGHDSVNKSAWLIRQGTIQKIIESPAAYDQRDDFAAALIKRTQDGGKYIMFGGGRHSKDDPERPSGIGVTTRLNIPSLNFWEPLIYYANEAMHVFAWGMGSSFAQSKANDDPLAHMREGKDRESTYKVTSWDEAIFTRSASYAFTPEEIQQIQALQSRTKDSGVCKPPANQKKIYLDTSDIDNLVQHLKKPDTGVMRAK